MKPLGVILECEVCGNSAISKVNITNSVVLAIEKVNWKVKTLDNNKGSVLVCPGCHIKYENLLEKQKENRLTFFES